MNYKLDGVDYSVKIIRKNNKNTYIRIKEDNSIQITTGYFATKHQLMLILKKNEKALKQMILNQQKKQEQDSTFLYLGESYHIICMPTNEVEMINQSIYATDEKQLMKWKQTQMKQLFQTRYEVCYNRFEEHIPLFQLKIRKMKTRWGVCNRKSRTITLNSELWKYKIEDLDYVIIHELSHLIHFDHSKEFWRVVEKYCPDYKLRKKELRGVE